MSQDNNIITEIKEIFNNINNWLNFAELKNGMIIVFDITIILACMSEEIKDKLQAYWHCIILFIFSISLLISLISYLPKIKSIRDKWLVPQNRNINDRNLLFYGDIFDLKDVEYIKLYYKNYYDKEIEEKDIKKLELHYVQELLVNSKIAVYKYYLFKIALILACIGIMLLFFSQIMNNFQINFSILFRC